MLAFVDDVLAASARLDEDFCWITDVNESVNEDTFADSSFPWQYSMGIETFDANLSSVLSRVDVGEFSRKVRIMKMEALERGRCVIGRRLLFAIDQHFKLAEADGAVFGMDHLLAKIMKGDNLERFVSHWDAVIAGMKKKPEDQVLQAIFMRQLRHCSRMKGDFHHYERLSGDDPRMSYPELYRAAKRQIERWRLQVHGDEMTKFIAGGQAMPVAPKGGKKG